MSDVVIQQKLLLGFKAQAQISNHAVGFDVPEEKGGRDTGPSPHDMLLASLGACTAITVRMYAKRKNWPLDDVTIEVSHEAFPKGQPIQKIITLTGDLTDEQRNRLYAIAEKCPVNQLLATPTEIVVKHHEGVL